MIVFRSILLSIFMFSISLSESIEITVYSNSFIIDTVDPEIELIDFPNNEELMRLNQYLLQNNQFQ